MTNEQLPNWGDYMAILEGAAAVLDNAPDMNDPQKQQEAYRLLFSAVASGYHSAFADPNHPDFVPVVSNILNSVGANPDFIYGYSQLDGNGCYRLSGIRGDEVFVLIDFTAGGLGVLDQLGPAVGFIDVDSLNIASDGSFEVLLSAEKPEDYTGDWYELNPDTKTASYRKAFYEWGDGKSTRLAIERLDSAPRGERLSAAETSRRLKLLTEYVSRYVGFIMGYGNKQRAEGYVNKLEHDDWAGRGGVSGQHYYQGIYELQVDEALIIETELPDKVRYWNIQVNDPIWNTIDWFTHQSSINGSQAKLDNDGKFRAVISVQDPGVPNWLDTGGHLNGSLMLRWTEASSGPEPALKIVPLAELRTHLPADTPQISAQQRAESLRARNKAAQFRCRW